MQRPSRFRVFVPLHQAIPPSTVLRRFFEDENRDCHGCMASRQLVGLSNQSYSYSSLRSGATHYSIAIRTSSPSITSQGKRIVFPTHCPSFSPKKHFYDIQNAESIQMQTFVCLICQSLIIPFAFLRISRCIQNT